MVSWGLGVYKLKVVLGHAADGHLALGLMQPADGTHC